MPARIFRRLRPEEGLLVFAFVASAVLTVYANVDLYQRHANSRRIRGGLLRLVVVAGMAAGLPWLERTLRTFLPFVMCIAVYPNLHDTVRYVNPHDIHPYLSAIEGWIFGGQPVLWAEAYITPARTEFFNAFYANFFLVAPSVVLILWFSGRTREARTVLLGIIVCFYTGYVPLRALPGGAAAPVLRVAGPVHGDAQGRPDHELPGVPDRDDAEPRGARGVSQPALGGELPEPTASFTFANNHSVSQDTPFGGNRRYWKAKGAQGIYSFVYSVNFELGPLSEASIGNVGLKAWPDDLPRSGRHAGDGPVDFSR
ncbi:MAG: hypothetical protein JJE40_02260 [Vicinamibacteria bacterium]|nr:hypothetical protein [Vicinamibacteria bacterium]